MSIYFDENNAPPLPVTLEKAHEEIRYLQSQLYDARKRYLNLYMQSLEKKEQK